MSDQQTKGGFTGDPAAALTVTGSSGCCGNAPQTTDFLAPTRERPSPHPAAVRTPTRRRPARAAAPRRRSRRSPRAKAAADDHADTGRRGPGRQRSMAATVAALAADPFTGRRVGTPGGAAARAWLAQRLADLGADVTFAPFPVRSVPDVYAAPTVRWHDGRTVHELGFGREVAMHLASAETPLARQGGLVVAGAGDPTGRWVLVPDGMSLFDAYGHADGAIGLLLGRGVDGYGWQYTMLAGPEPGHLPVLTLAMPVSRPCCDQSSLVRRQRADATRRRHRRERARTVPRCRRRRGRSLAHRALRRRGRPSRVSGSRRAADNGSGVAVVLEAARVLAADLPAGVGLSVALLDGEEVGALGSAHHAAQLLGDATAGRQRRRRRPPATRPPPSRPAVPRTGCSPYSTRPAGTSGCRWGPRPVASDNRRYGAAGLPAVGIGAGMAGYHSPADTADRVETATLTAIARLVVATGWLAAAVPANLSSLIGDKR